MDRFDLDRFLPYRLAVAAERVSAGLARQYRQRFGLTVAEWRILAHLLHQGEVSIRDIEGRANLEKSKASRAAANLTSRGLIVKSVNPADKRLIELKLTDKGHNLMAQLVPIAQAYQAELEERLGQHLSDFEAGIDLIIKD